MASGKAIAGGLLAGFGEGLVAQAQVKREEAKERARMLREQLERDQTHRNNLERDRLRDERNAGLLGSTVTDEQGNVYGVTRGGKTIDLGIRTAPPGLKGKSGSSGDDDPIFEMSEGERRVYNEIKERYTDPILKKTDWQAFVQHLRSMPGDRGGERWNQIADFLTGDVGALMTEAEAAEAAEHEARSRRRGPGGIFGSGFDTPEERDAFIQSRARELRGGRSSERGEPPPQQDLDSGQGRRFASPEAVREAHRSGQISKEEALRILRSEFGFQ